MTRALQALLAGDLAASFAWHPMALPTLAFGMVWAGLMLAKKKKAAWTVLMVWASLMLACWLIRLVWVFPQNPIWQKPGLVQKLLARMLP